jgi:hypothetical protein
VIQLDKKHEFGNQSVKKNKDTSLNILMIDNATNIARGAP